ncbi:hypothetical protein ACFL6Y_11355 [Elusimicrobiota bacterium]
MPRQIIYIFISAMFFFGQLAQAQTIALSDKEIEKIGQKIFMNECGGKLENLTAWNKGEDFASLGIGHFIWYPKNKKGPFQESFPGLISFISEAATYPIPEWLNSPENFCPWNTKKEFYQAINSTKMQELKSFLESTIHFQALYIIGRLENALPKMIAATEEKQKERIANTFTRLSKTSSGMYALIDYVNFKGEGVLESERYNDLGWGLLQVLEEMNENVPDSDLINEFIRAAEFVLTRRVANSPKKRNEIRWLPGWKSRLQTYKN